MKDRIAIFCLIFAAGYAYVEASNPQAPANDVTPIAPEVPGDVGVPDVVGASAIDWTQCVFPVRQRLSNGISHGTAVSLGEGLLVTAAHVVQANTYPEVEIDGQWVRAGFRRVANQDVAYLTINETSLPGVSTRPPDYGEAATAYGNKTATPMRGRISDDDSLSLDASEAGIDQGDSGGGVFGDDGLLLGTIRSHRSGNRRVVKFTTLTPPEPYSRSQSTVQSAPQSTVPNCQGGVCRIRK